MKHVKGWRDTYDLLCFPYGKVAVRAEALPISATPEPGTLALVGIGLASVALRRFRPSPG
jgi:hypothetical protein